MRLDLQDKRQQQQRRDFELSKLDRNLRYESDDNMQREDSPLKKWLIAGAVAAGGVAAYKSGALRHGIKTLMESANDYRAFGKEASGSLRHWLSDSMYEGVDSDNPIQSIFRGGKNLLSKESLARAVKDSDYRAGVVDGIINDTKRDLSNLRTNFNERQKVATEGVTRRHLSTNTKLTRDFRDIERTRKEISQEYGAETGAAAHRAMVERFLAKNTLSESDRLKSLKRTGSRQLTFGDLFELDKNNSFRFKMEHQDKWDVRNRIRSNDGKIIAEENFSQFESLINKFGNTVIEVGGETMSVKDSNLWKNVKIDGGLFMDESGRVLDVRGAQKEFNTFVDSLANDFQIPAVGLNPLRLFGVGQNKLKSTNFGMLHRNTVNPFVTGKAGGASTIGNVFGDDAVFFADGDVYKIGTSKLNTSTQKIASNFEFYDLRRAGDKSTVLPDELRQTQILANIKSKKYEEYTQADGPLKNAWGKIGRALDLGRHDGGHIFEYGDTSPWRFLSPDYYANKMNAFLGRRINTAKGVEDLTKVPGEDVVRPTRIFGDDTTTQTRSIQDQMEQTRLFVGVRKSHNFRDIFSEDSDLTFKDFLSQFMAGRDKDGNMSENLTRTSLNIFDLFNRPIQALEPFSIGLSSDSKRSTVNLMGNVLLKRVLPIYAGYQAYQYMDYLSETDPDGDGNPNTLTKSIATGLKDIDLGWHVLKDAAGITQLRKDIGMLTPGSDQTPLALITDQTAEERHDWYENGVVEVRKGRYWALGNTPLTGGKIDYYAPNWYRRTMADIRFSDSQYGSREEYFDNAWFPTPTSPFAPIRHFITDPYYYDHKHMHSRPYPVTSGLFSQVPIVGGAMDATIGEILKPQRAMHVDEMKEIKKAERQQRINQEELAFASMVASEISGSQIGVSGINPDDVENAQTVSYVTPSGNTSVVGIQASDNVTFINQELANSSLSKLTRVNTRNAVAVSTSALMDSGGKPLNTSHASVVGGDLFEQLSDIQGMKGFLIKGFGVGSLQTEGRVLESADYAFSSNRRFWDESVGGLGGDVMEIFRRFIPQRRKDVEWYNPIANNMADWLPGDDYFTNFQQGDPYTKVQRGEMRLPGEAYERLWGLEDVDQLSVNARLVGRSKEELMDHFQHNQGLGRGNVSYANANAATNHVISEIMKTEGIRKDVWASDEDSDITGSFDVLIYDPASSTGRGVMNVKALSTEDFNDVSSSGRMLDNHASELNYHMYASGNEGGRGYITYVDELDPTRRLRLGMDFDARRLSDDYTQINDARSEITKQLERGDINKGSLYDPISRYRILADIAPYSEAYRTQRTLASEAAHTDEEKAEVKAIAERVSAQKEPHRLTPYQFKTADVETKTVTITGVLDNDTFKTLEFGDNPIKLAGVNVKNITGWDKVTTADIVSDYIRVGSRVTVAYDADETQRISNDSLKTIRASVTHRGVNINRQLVKDGVAEFDEDDTSAAGVHARFNAIERTVGSAWESFAHLNTPFHTKFLHVRSALEMYKRKEVYGKDFKRWTHPIDDFLKPAVNESIEREPITGLAVSTLIGLSFGRNKYGRTVGAAVGAATYVVGKTLVSTSEITNGTKWIPRERLQERELEGYIDKLKYVKNRHLYEEYRQRALEEDRFNVEAYMKSQKKKGYKNKQERSKLENKKRLLKLKNPEGEIEIFGQSIDLEVVNNKRIKGLTSAINALKGQRRIDAIPENALKAIHYYNESEKTMYGYDPGEPLTNVLQALPKRDRQYFQSLLEAPVQERAEILRIAPDYMARILASSWGYAVGPKEDLHDYFQTHALPDVDWSGWDENVDLEAVRVKLVKSAGLDPAEFDIWDDQLDMANAHGEMAIPKIKTGNSTGVVSARLRSLLSAAGYEDIRIEARYSGSTSETRLDITEDAGHGVQSALEERRLL